MIYDGAQKLADYSKRQPGPMSERGARRSAIESCGTLLAVPNDLINSGKIEKWVSRHSRSANIVDIA